MELPKDATFYVNVVPFFSIKRQTDDSSTLRRVKKNYVPASHSSTTPMSYATTLCSYSGATSRRADFTRLYPSILRRRFFNTTGAANNIAIIDKITNMIPAPPLRLGPLNPKSDHVSGGSQMISSYPVGFKQFGPVQLARH